MKEVHRLLKPGGRFASISLSVQKKAIKNTGGDSNYSECSERQENQTMIATQTGITA
tara:strand:- start:111 stop:281 length:171 start_codon:yes stop_codon:yes gene_type:complete